MQDTIVTTVSAQLLTANSTALVTATPKTIPIVGLLGALVTAAGGVFLNAGLWRLQGNINFVFAATTTGTNIQGGFSLVTNTLPTEDAGLTGLTLAFPAGAPTTQSLVLEEIVISVGQQGATIFMVAQAAFATSTLTANGSLNCYQLAP